MQKRVRSGQAASGSIDTREGHARPGEEARTTRALAWLVLGIVLCWWVARPAAAAGPLNLDDPTPRWIGVRFEVSPRTLPGLLDHEYSPVYRAWLDGLEHPGELRILIPGDVVESLLDITEDCPIRGTFSDFVWHVDTATGDVLSAEVTGRVLRRLDWGLIETRQEVDIRVRMSTATPAGFHEPRRLLGNLMSSYCVASDDPACTMVDPVPFDRDRGYVNAVGAVEVDSPIASFLNFSPLGEALFHEIVPEVSAGGPAAAAVAEAPVPQSGERSESEPVEVPVSARGRPIGLQ